MELSYLGPVVCAIVAMLVCIYVYGPDELRKPVTPYTLGFTACAFLFGLILPAGGYAVWVYKTAASLDPLVVILVGELCMIAMIITLFAVWLCTLPPYTRKA